MLFERVLNHINDKYSEKIGTTPFKEVGRLDLVLSGLAIGLAAVSIALAVLRLNILGLSLLSAEVAILLFPWLYAFALVKEYESKALESSLIISIATYVMSVLGKDVFTALRALASRGNKVADTEFRVLLTKVKVFGKTAREALNERAQSLSGTPLAQLYRLYVSTGELGLSLTMRLEDFVKGLLNDLSQSIEHRINTLAEISEATLSLFVLLPMLAMGLSMLEGVQVQLLIVPLLVAPGLYFLIASYSFSPKISYNLNVLDLAVVVLGVFAMLYSSIVLKNVGVSIVVFSLSIALWFYLRYYKPAEALFDSLPALATVIGDKIRLGHSFAEAFDSSLVELTKGNKLLRRAISLYRAGVLTFLKDFADTAELAYEGSFSGIYDELARIYSNLVAIRKSYQRKASTFLALAVISPAILYYELHTFSGIISASLQTYGFLIGLLSFALSVLFSKAYKGTVFYFPIYLAVGLESLILSALWA